MIEEIAMDIYNQSDWEVVEPLYNMLYKTPKNYINKVLVITKDDLIILSDKQLVHYYRTNDVVITYEFTFIMSIHILKFLLDKGICIDCYYTKKSNLIAVFTPTRKYVFYKEELKGYIRKFNKLKIAKASRLDLLLTL